MIGVVYYLGYIDTMTWYKKYTGLPYKHLGSSVKDGIDCFNLCKYIYKQELDIDISYSTSDFCNIVDDQWYQYENRELMLNAAKIKEDNFSWEKVLQPRVYDLILLSIGSSNITNHCAMYVDRNKLLHTVSGRKSWIAPYGNYYKQYTTGIYRWNGLKT